MPETIQPCRVCGHGPDAGSLFSANGYEWLRCGHCGSVQKTLSYQQYRQLDPGYDPGVYLDAASPAEIERYLEIDKAQVIIGDIARRHVSSTVEGGAKRSFLDVGCGMGTYLLAAQRLGFEVLGFEPSADHARVAVRHLDLPIVADYFSRDRVGERKFDLIMLSHVIEHIYSPREFLHELVSLLKPGGALIVITPNSDSLAARITGRHWPMLRPVDHVTMLNAKAYAHFGLDGLAQVRHWHTEFSWEFAATIAAAIKAQLRPAGGNARAGAAQAAAAPPILRRAGVKTRLVKGVLTLASAPAAALATATGRRACLNTAIIREG